MRQWSDRVSGLIISLQNFKKPSDIFSPQRITFQRIFSYNSCCKRTLWVTFLSRVHLWKTQTPGSRLKHKQGFQRHFNTCLREWKLLSLHMVLRVVFLLLIVSSLDVRLISLLAWTVCKLFFSKITYPHQLATGWHKYIFIQFLGCF